jgi:signal transduction histidine kinase
MVTAIPHRSPRIVRKRSFAWLVAAAVAFTAFGAVWIGTHPGHNRPAVALDDISETLAPLGAAIVCFLAARRRTTSARAAWALIGLSALSWGLGQADWTVREVFLNQNPASLFPSWPDVGYVAAIPLGIAGLIALPAFRGAGTRISLLLDGLLMVGGALFVSWATILGPIYADSATGFEQQFLSLVYPLSDVFMGTIVILALSRMAPAGRRPFVYLGVGVLFTALADSTFAYLTTVQNVDTANPTDMGWTLGYILIGLGALRAMAPADGPTERTVQNTRWRMVLPYLPMIAAGLVVVGREMRGVGLDAFMLWDSFGIVTIVLLRQFILVRQTRSLGLQLQQQNRQLDHLVDERTRELDHSLEGLREANDRRKGLLLRLVTLQDEERRRLAGIIHDDMLQWMAVGHTRLQISRRAIADPKQASSLDRAADAVQASITRMRTLMSELHPQVVERGFTTALGQYLEQVEHDGDLHCVLDGGFANEPSGTVATTLYRITCEAIVNARKHAAGSTVTVKLSDRDAGYAVTVRDDGPGFVPEGTGYSPTGHVGLSSMRERSEALGGSWSLESRPGAGTTVRCWVPREDATAPAPAVVSDAELAAVVADLGGGVTAPAYPLPAMVPLPGSAAPVPLGVGPAR